MHAALAKSITDSTRLKVVCCNWLLGSAIIWETAKLNTLNQSLRCKTGKRDFTFVGAIQGGQTQNLAIAGDKAMSLGVITAVPVLQHLKQDLPTGHAPRLLTMCLGSRQGCAMG